LFVVGEGEIPSCEGTTQGDPLAMGMYALAVVPLIRRLRVAVPSVQQVWFMDDATAVGKLKALRRWWQILSSLGPNFGYFSNVSKTALPLGEQGFHLMKQEFCILDMVGNSQSLCLWSFIFY